MTWILITLFIILASFIIIYLKLIDNKKYQKPTYLSNLQEITLFFDTIEGFDDYVTWVRF